MRAELWAEVLSQIQYLDWSFEVGFDADASPWLRVVFEADGSEQKGRKWRLSPHMVRSELVQTTMLAVMTAVEHEAREHFRYRGHAIFGPHFDVDALHDVCENYAETRR